MQRSSAFDGAAPAVALAVRGFALGGAARAGAPAAVMIAAVALLALPSTMLAFSNRLEVAPAEEDAPQGLTRFVPGEIDPRLARAIAARPPGTGPMFRFTPAGIAARPGRSVTVAVRVDSETASTIIVRAPAAPRAPAGGGVPVRVASSAYSLGMAHGYQGFAPGTQPLLGTLEARRTDLPDLTGFSLSDPDTPASRLAARISLAEKDRAGRAPRTLEGAGEQQVDLGGSYRLTRNLDVTAGVRYSQDRDRLKPLTDGKQDDQAVFVGTRVRF